MSADGVVVTVRRALRKQLTAIAAAQPAVLPALAQWQVEGTTFIPTIDVPWLRETMLRAPGAPPQASIGPQALIRHSGGWQISLFYPPDDPADTYPIESAGEAIRAAFPSSLELTYEGQLVRLVGTGLGTIAPTTMQGMPWLHLPVRVEWYADTYNVN
jgi:hypothetical protein